MKSEIFFKIIGVEESDWNIDETWVDRDDVCWVDNCWIIWIYFIIPLLLHIFDISHNLKV